MKVLIVDDYESTRALLRRILIRDYSCAVVEAENGVDALDKIGSHDFTFVLLDVQMPIMDGIETLQAIRKSSEQPDLPVVMLSAERDEMKVRRILSLGITDYLSKPLKTEHISSRLARIVGGLGNPRTCRGLGDALTLDKSALVLLADGDADFRHFFADVLGSLCTVATAGSGAHAFKMALQSPPRVIFLGSRLGALDRDLFVNKARGLTQLKASGLVAVVPKNEMDRLRQTGVFDGVVARTFVPEVFKGQIERLFHTRTALRRLLLRHPTLRGGMITAIEQVFGMMLSADVTLLPATLESGAGDGLLAAVEITIPDEDLRLGFQVSCDAEAARVLGAGLTSAAPATVSEADALSALQEVANMITGRLQNTLREAGIQATCSLPRTHVGPLPPPPVDGDDGIIVHVESTRQSRFRMMLAGAPSEPGIVEVPGEAPGTNAA